MNCKYCRANCTGARKDREIALCLGYDPPKTNADQIRNMTDEELAELWWEKIDCGECPLNKDCLLTVVDCIERTTTWLRQECE